MPILLFSLLSFGPLICLPKSPPFRGLQVRYDAYAVSDAGTIASKRRKDGRDEMKREWRRFTPQGKTLGKTISSVLVSQFVQGETKHAVGRARKVGRKRERVFRRWALAESLPFDAV